MANQPKLICVVGATASGKTSLGIKLAQQHKTEILSADSRQFYREMNIGVAKPTSDELAAAKHHFVNSLSIHDDYSAGDFEKDALAILNELFKEHSTAIMVGGSGLFIKAVVEGLDHFPEVEATIREELNIRLENEGIQSLQNQLEELDPESFSSISTDNPRRLIRALEVCLSSGKPYSYFKNLPKEKRLFETEYVGIDWPRETLYERINERCEQMLTNGLLKEAESLHNFKHLNACQTVGYQEFFEYFDGNCSLDQAIEKFKQHTRNYAKRQITWFKKLDGVKWLQPSELE